MFSLEKQLKLISFFTNLPDFKWKCIIVDNRFFPIISWCFDELKIWTLSSLDIFLPSNIGFSVWKFYPKSWTKLWELFEKLVNSWIEIDIDIVEVKYYNEFNNNKILFKWLNVSLEEKSEYVNYTKETNFDIKNYHHFIKKYLKAIKPDDNSIRDNIDMYYKNYIRYINFYQNNINNELPYKKQLYNYFLYIRLIEFKNRIKFYKTLYNAWYKTLDEVFSWKTLDFKEINYYKNISVKKDLYDWKVHKVYNVISSKQLKKGDIMVAENTNPEFINAFYDSSFICVETDSELSHAAITCKELDIPLALWSNNIFLATDNGQHIKINTNQKIINLK